MTSRRTFLVAGGALTLSACATTPLGSPESTEVAAPRWSPGDSWSYSTMDGYNGLDRGIVTRTVQSVGADGIRVVKLYRGGAVAEDELFESPGVQIAGMLSNEGPYHGGTFDPHLIRYDFPLRSGKAWAQTLWRTDANKSRYYSTASTRVEGWEDVQSGGKTYRAIIVRRTMYVGESYTQGGRLHREELDWYVPELRAYARQRIFEWRAYSIGIEPAERLNVQLESFKLA
jgi:hypothetical protein